MDKSERSTLLNILAVDAENNLSDDAILDRVWCLRDKHDDLAAQVLEAALVRKGWTVTKASGSVSLEHPSGGLQLVVSEHDEKALVGVVTLRTTERGHGRARLVGAQLAALLVDNGWPWVESIGVEDDGDGNAE